MPTNENSLRLYSNTELKAAIKELLNDPYFLQGMEKFLPATLNQQLLAAQKKVNHVEDFQTNLMLPLLREIEKRSITKLSVSGVEALDKKEKYLFISNHRDIGLDSAYLNLLLFDNGMTTAQIAVGDNLMKHRLAELIFRINKSFVVKRSGAPRELYAYSIELSNYIYETIHNKTDSIWIAQREGRAKDGNDRTQVALLKMLGMSKKTDLITHFKDLKIVPVAISYEYDPCAFFKTQEYLQKQADPNYKKTFEQDVASILQGLKGEKGNLHIHFGKPLDEEIDLLATEKKPKNQLEILAKAIDKSIHLNYQLHPVNYVAYDLLTETETYKSEYDDAIFKTQKDYFEVQLSSFTAAEKEVGRSYLLGMYANPLINARAYESVNVW